VNFVQSVKINETILIIFKFDLSSIEICENEIIFAMFLTGKALLYDSFKTLFICKSQ